jgi:hypothetical protein
MPLDWNESIFNSSFNLFSGAKLIFGGKTEHGVILAFTDHKRRENLFKLSCHRGPCVRVEFTPATSTQENTTACSLVGMENTVVSALTSFSSG